MKVIDIYDMANGNRAVFGATPWKDNATFAVGDVLVREDNRKWRVSAISRIMQGCFAQPESRHHRLQLEPIDHTEQPIQGDILEKQ
jgi:hypothetical protein